MLLDSAVARGTVLRAGGHLGVSGSIRQGSDLNHKLADEFVGLGASRVPSVGELHERAAGVVLQCPLESCLSERVCGVCVTV